MPNELERKTPKSGAIVRVLIPDFSQATLRCPEQQPQDISRLPKSSLNASEPWA
jgi:hypothetical protein